MKTKIDNMMYLLLKDIRYYLYQDIILKILRRKILTMNEQSSFFVNQNYTNFDSNVNWKTNKNLGVLNWYFYSSVMKLHCSCDAVSDRANALSSSITFLTVQSESLVMDLCNLAPESRN